MLGDVQRRAADNGAIRHALTPIPLITLAANSIWKVLASENKMQETEAIPNESMSTRRTP